MQGTPTVVPKEVLNQQQVAGGEGTVGTEGGSAPHIHFWKCSRKTNSVTAVNMGGNSNLLQGQESSQCMTKRASI